MAKARPAEAKARKPQRPASGVCAAFAKAKESKVNNRREAKKRPERVCIG